MELKISSLTLLVRCPDLWPVQENGNDDEQDDDEDGDEEDS